jgi:hypothetical protein
MKLHKLFIINLLLLLTVLTGCSNHYSYDHETLTNEIESSQSKKNENKIKNTLYMDTLGLTEPMKQDLLQLSTLWSEFRQQISADADPTEDFKKSQFLIGLKDFLSKRESLALSPKELGQLLCQNDIYSQEKTYFIAEKQYNIRVIGYNADLYVQLMTDKPIQSKWTFVQCWNEDEFYFTTLSDGDYCYFRDFIPLIIADKLNILITGQNMYSGPYPIFLKTFELGKDGFSPSKLFPTQITEDADCVMYNTIDLNNFHRENKWMLYTDGYCLYVERGWKNNEEPVQFLSTNYILDEENNKIEIMAAELENQKKLNIIFDATKFVLETK